jgi:hypothetical protein
MFKATHTQSDAVPPLLQVATKQRSALPVALGAAVGVLVCFPFFGGGRVILLDWIIGPHQQVLPQSAYGLGGGLVTGVPLTSVLAALAHVGGTSASWLPILLFFPLAAFSISRLAGGTLVCRLGATLLYCVNPFVFERVFAGQIGFLLGYAVLPLAIGSIVSAPDRGWRGAFAPVVWIAVLAGCSPHFAWILGLVAAVVFLQSRGGIRSTVWLGAVAGGAVLTSLYAIVGPAASNVGVGALGASDLAAYRTTADPHLGLYVNLAGLYGFWRGGSVLPKDVVGGWPFILLILVVIAGAGLRAGLRQPGSRRLATVLVVSGIAGYVLALGDQGPAGSLYRWLYLHLPGFDIMREPEKFVCLLAVAYAVLFGWGVEKVAATSGRQAVRVGLAIAVAVPVAYTPTLFGGLDGQVRPSAVPPSWALADRTMGSGAGQVLFLPWHEYMSFPFTNNRIVANPAPSYFRRPVISGDNVELNVPTESTSARSAFLESAFAQGPEIRQFGALLAPLDISYVVLAKTVDWRQYGWLNDQRDLVLVLDTPTLSVWRNNARPTLGQVVPRSQLATNVGALLEDPPSSSGTGTVTRPSPVTYMARVPSAGTLEISEPYDAGWRLDGRRPLRLPEGNMAWSVGPGTVRVVYQPWGLVRDGYVGSLLAFVIAVVMAILDRRNRSNTIQLTGDCLTG